MKFIIQRVTKASVTIDNQIAGSIDKGFMVLIGICGQDTKEVAYKMLHKMLNLRIFQDGTGKTNLSLKDVDGNLLLISQFTLYADCRKGNRPSFIKAGNKQVAFSPEDAEELYDIIVAECRKEFPNTQTGVFGANMQVELINDGPFTIILDSDEIM